MNQENPFIPGIYAKKPSDNAPDFIKCKLSIKREALLEFLQSNQEEWINAEVKETKAGDKLVVFIDTWKPQQQQQSAPQARAPFPDDDIPFG